ncbi:Heparinase II/III N-terminus [Granulicatella balaenopterae]|uniref:Heparinase II/III N-terminus n=1 Tax=Granulicatella balaenopterae TaxID=137733 RepID=A0A1H9LX74_9LACT|nr:heparinase II/III family protein [Granulicatella balaenopterae]SER15958.1 Heparinase II/III N-terminus [Granulicatella balaenopterae]
MKLLTEYQSRVSSNEFINKINKSSSNYLLGLFDRCGYLLEDNIVFTDALDMEACDTSYSLSRYKWKSSPNNDDEWIFMLSRQGFLVDLAIAYHLTADERYLAKWKELIFSFIKQEGTASDLNQLCWRPLDSGLRLSNWIKSLVYLPQDGFSEAEWLALQEAISYHLYYQRETFVSKYLLSNWGVLALCGVAMYQILADDVCEDDVLWQILSDQWELQFTNQGTHWEQSPMYQHEVMMQFANVLQCAEVLNQPLPFDLRKKLTLASTSSYYQVDQDDCLLALNDSDAVDCSYIYDFYRGLGLLQDKKNEDWNQSAILIGEYYFNRTKKEEIISYSTLFCDQKAGLAVLKNEKWYLTCFNGLHGSSHGQASAGSITLNYKGQNVLIDSGRYSYMECVERMRLNSEEAHNVPSLKEQPGTIISGSWSYQQLTNPVAMMVKSFEEGYFIETSWQTKQHDTKEMALVTRRILLFEDFEMLLVMDSCESSRKDELRNYFHVDSDFRLEQLDSQFIQANSNSQQVGFWNLSPVTIQEAIHSPVYNQLAKHPVIMSSTASGDSLLNVMVVSMNQAVTIEEVMVKQNNEENPFHDCFGIRCIQDNSCKEVYLTVRDIISKDKLLVTEDEKYFYGRLVVFNDGQMLRIQ